MTTAAANPKFFMDLVWVDSSASPRVVDVGWNAWGFGSHLGRFHKVISIGPTATGTDTTARCAIISP